MDFLCEFECRSGDTFWELLALTGSLLEDLELGAGASRSDEILSVQWHDIVPECRNKLDVDRLPVTGWIILPPP